MNTPFVARVRTLFPKAEIALLGRKSVAPLFVHHPHSDHIWPIDDKSAKGFREAAAKLRAFRADLGFLLPNSLNSAALFAAGGVKMRVGYDRDARRSLLTHPIPLRPEDLAVHEVRYYLRLLHGWETASRAPDPLLLNVTAEEREAMRGWLRENGLDDGQFLLGINPAALYGTAKRWLPDRFAEVGRHFIREHGARVVVTGLEKERDVAQEVCDFGGEGFVNGAGRMTLRELMAFLQQCNLFVTNDSGAMHIAAALGTPLAAVFGSTDWVTTAPVGAHTRIVRVDTPCAPCLLRHCPIDHRCMTGVTAAAVVAKAEELLSMTPSRTA
jgi:heptosyltransferase-2